MRAPVWILGLVVLACDQRADVGDLPARDGGVGADTGVSGDPLTAFCNDLYEIKCGASPTCCSDPARVYDSQAECVSNEAIGCVKSIGDSPVYRLGKATIGAAPARTILTEATRAAEACLNEGGIGPPLVGTLAQGDDCTFTLSDGFFLACQAGLACIADRVEGATGHELYHAHCGAPLGDGATCVTGAPGQCGQGHYCDGTCKASLPRNSPCTDSRACEGRLECSATTGRCELPTLPADDAYCLNPAVVGPQPKNNGGPDGCSAGSGTASDTCYGEWVCPAQTYRLECGQASGDCVCRIEGAEVGRFHRVSACNGGGGAFLWELGQTNCGFP